MFYPLFENQDFKIEQTATLDDYGKVIIRAADANEDETKVLEMEVDSYLIKSCSNFTAEEVFELVQIVKDLEEVILVKGKGYKEKEEINSQLQEETTK